MSKTLTQPQQRASTPYLQLSPDGTVKLEQADEIVIRCRQLIRRHPHFRCRERSVRIEMRHNRLILSGQLPSWFLKQLAQEAIREIENVLIDNRIVVCG